VAYLVNTWRRAGRSPRPGCVSPCYPVGGRVAVARDAGHAGGRPQSVVALALGAGDQRPHNRPPPTPKAHHVPWAHGSAPPGQPGWPQAAGPAEQSAWPSPPWGHPPDALPPGPGVVVGALRWRGAERVPASGRPPAERPEGQHEPGAELVMGLGTTRGRQWSHIAPPGSARRRFHTRPRQGGATSQREGTVAALAEENSPCSNALPLQSEAETAYVSAPVERGKITHRAPCRSGCIRLLPL
jgi:hypothetical protein